MAQEVSELSKSCRPSVEAARRVDEACTLATLSPREAARLEGLGQSYSCLCPLETTTLSCAFRPALLTKPAPARAMTMNFRKPAHFCLLRAGPLSRAVPTLATPHPSRQFLLVQPTGFQGTLPPHPIPLRP